MTYQEFKEKVIEISGKRKIEDYELYYAEEEAVSVEIYRQEVKEYNTETSAGVCYRCIIDGRTGYASTEDLTEEEAGLLVERAMENAGSIESREKSFLHKCGDTYEQPAPLEEETPSGAELVDAALALQKAMYEADSRVTDGTQSFVIHAKETFALCNSNGLDLEDRAGYALAMGEALIPDGEDMYYGGKDKDGSFSKLDLKKLAAETVEEALSGIGAKSVPSGKYHIVFTGEAFAQLLTTFDSVFSAEMAQKGMSLLSGREGERIAAECVTLIDDPMHPENPVRRTFDAEGVAAHKKNVVEDGTLKTLLHNLSTAAKAGVSSTGNGQKMTYSSAVSVGPFTFYLKPCQGTGQELIAEAKTGLCIKEVSGLHAGANPITGDFSLLAAGYRFEGGKRTFPVKNITVSGNFYTLLKEIDRVGDDLKFIRTRGGKCGSPSVLVRDMSVAGEG